MASMAIPKPYKFLLLKEESFMLLQASSSSAKPIALMFPLRK